MVVWGIPEESARGFFQQAGQKVTEWEEILSRYRPGSEVFDLNHRAFREEVPVSDRLWNVLLQSVDYSNRTRGYFDCTRGYLYDEVKRGGIMKQAIASEIIDRIRLNASAKTVFFLCPDVALDFGGMGKGIALNDLAEELVQWGIENAFISFGNSSVLTRGRHPHGDYWPFSLAGGKADGKIWELTNDAVSVSSSPAGEREGSCHHIANPRTGQTPQSRRSVVVRARNPVDAEVLSTCLLAAPENEQYDWVYSFGNVEIEIING
ncbi:MAG TPA: FAD:protein FMN transferase, partial [Prolixibacteraceae bacterium]|nr:FAD:protein FMN transferase [Prolixibacteraceae bacterium]